MIRVNDIDAGIAIAKAIPRDYNPLVDQVISNHSKDGKLLGGVIYDGKTSNCIFAHQASFSRQWLMGPMLWVIFDYPFNQLKVGKLAGTIPSSDTKLLEFNQRLGFKEEGRIKDAYLDGDLIVMTMTRAECRWLNLKPPAPMRNRTEQP